MKKNKLTLNFILVVFLGFIFIYILFRFLAIKGWIRPYRLVEKVRQTIMNDQQSKNIKNFKESQSPNR
jgi:hypothetical protein